MNKIALTIATLLLASGTAFAQGSDHYGSDDGYATSVTNPSATAEYSYPAQFHAMKNVGIGSGEAASQGNSTFDIPAPGYGQGMWGNR